MLWKNPIMPKVLFSSLPRLTAVVFAVSVIAPFPALSISAAEQQKLFIEIDKLDTAVDMPDTVSRNGKSYTLGGIYKTVNIDLKYQKDENIKDLHPDRGYNRQELHGMHLASANKVPTDGSWFVHLLLATRSSEGRGIYGVMFEPQTRRSFAVFTTEIGGDKERLLRTSAHELGHALNMFHSDGDGDIRCCNQEDDSITTGTTIMNQTRCLSNNWSYEFGSKEKDHLLKHGADKIRPGSEFMFGKCIDGHSGLC